MHKAVHAGRGEVDDKQLSTAADDVAVSGASAACACVPAGCWRPLAWCKLEVSQIEPACDRKKAQVLRAGPCAASGGPFSGFWRRCTHHTRAGRAEAAREGRRRKPFLCHPGSNGFCPVPRTMATVRRRAVTADGDSSAAPRRLAAGTAAPAEARPCCRWPLLPGCWADDPQPARKAWLACSLDRTVNG